MKSIEKKLPPENVKQIKKILIDKGIKVSQLADMLQRARWHVSAVINGRCLGYKTREEIAFTLNVPYETLWRTYNLPKAA